MNKRNPAFSMFEAMAALVIASSALFLAARMQVSSFNRMRLLHEQIDRIYLIKKNILLFFIQRPHKVTEKKVEKLETPLVTLSTQYEEIPRKSSLYELHDRLRRVASYGEWKEGPIGRSINHRIGLFTCIVDPSIEKQQ